MLSALYRVVRFHLGTMAAGSFILAAFTAVAAPNPNPDPNPYPYP